MDAAHILDVFYEGVTTMESNVALAQCDPI